jgi:hypothetical protein
MRAQTRVHACMNNSSVPPPQPSLDGAEIALAVNGDFVSCPASGTGATMTVVCAMGGVGQYVRVLLPSQLRSAAAGQVMVSVCVQPGQAAVGPATVGWQGA